MSRVVPVQRTGCPDPRVQEAAAGILLPAALPPARFVTDAANAPAVAGAYLLLLTLDAPLSVALPHRVPVALPVGRYLYAGSARGPCGLRARLARHLRRDKAVHWHIDRITTVVQPDGAW